MDISGLLQNPLLGFVLAPFIKLGVDKLKRQIGTLDRSSALVKQGAAVALAAVAVLAGQAAVNPSNIGQTLQSIDPAVVQNILVAGLGAIASKSKDQSNRLGPAPVDANTPPQS